MPKCEKCEEEKQSVHPRPDLGYRPLCTECNQIELRRISPTGLVKVPAHLRAGAAR